MNWAHPPAVAMGGMRRAMWEVEGRKAVNRGAISEFRTFPTRGEKSLLANNRARGDAGDGDVSLRVSIAQLERMS
jgi:hypothetical protein